MGSEAGLEVVAGGDRFVVRASRTGDQWVACAERAGSGDRFGPPQIAPTEAEAAARMARWLRWQSAHADALAELQRAERAYHRLVTGQAFTGSPEEGASALTPRDGLSAIESARIRLDAVRNQRPV